MEYSLKFLLPTSSLISAPRLIINNTIYILHTINMIGLTFHKLAKFLKCPITLSKWNLMEFKHITIILVCHTKWTFVESTLITLNYEIVQCIYYSAHIQLQGSLPLMMEISYNFSISSWTVREFGKLFYLLYKIISRKLCLQRI